MKIKAGTFFWMAHMMMVPCAEASSILITQVTQYVGSSFRTAEICSDDAIDTIAIESQSSCSQNFFTHLNDIQVRVDAEAFGAARASFGSLGVMVDTHAQIGDNPGAGLVEARAEASARMDDTFFVEGASSGLLEFVFTMSGSGDVGVLNGNGNGSGSWGVLLVERLTGAAFTASDWADGTVRILVPFGTAPTPVSFAFNVSAMCLVWGGAVCDSEASYFHSATITGLSALDHDGTPFDNVAIRAESGHRYLQGQPAPVPEPTSLLLLGGGMAGVWLKVRRTRHLRV